MNTTTIQWTELSWNPTTGCDKISPGCKHCYVEAITRRFKNGFVNGFDFTIHPDRFEAPRHWKKPARIFVNSMSDLFHEEMPPEVLKQLFAVMRDCPQHIFQILTKRHRRLAELAPDLEWHPNIWIGVSVENQVLADERISCLVSAPARVRFLSAEPLLEPVELKLSGINWVIVGGESGPRCRLFRPDWARSIRNQCARAGVAFFLKQLGGHPDKRDCLTDFPSDLRIREYPTNVPCNSRLI